MHAVAGTDGGGGGGGGMLMMVQEEQVTDVGLARDDGDRT